MWLVHRFFFPYVHIISVVGLTRMSSVPVAFKECT